LIRVVDLIKHSFIRMHMISVITLTNQTYFILYEMICLFVSF
jgi:hypothetical protein